MTPTVVVVVPTWNGADRLVACLDSISAQTLRPVLTVVVDNGSVDGSGDLARKHPSRPEVLSLPVNTGFAGGVNAGIRRVLALQTTTAGIESVGAVALLNDDAVADPGWLEHLVAELGRHPRTFAVAAKMLRTDGTLDSTGELVSCWGLPHPRGRGEQDLHQYDDQRDIPAASGGASLFRLAGLQAVGLFDEDFFAYYEDVELGLRARLRGWQVRYAPEAVVHHEVGAASGAVAGFRDLQAVRNSWLLVLRVFPRRLLLSVLPRLLLAHVLTCVGLTRRGHFGVVVRAHVQLLRLMPRTVAARRTRIGGVAQNALDSQISLPRPPRAPR